MAVCVSCSVEILVSNVIQSMKWRESHSQLCKKNSCSVKLQGGPLDHNPRKIPVENSWKIILHKTSKCLLLNAKQMPHEILFSLLDEIQNTKKDENTRIERMEVWKKVRGIGWVVLTFIHTFQPLRCPKREVYNEPNVYLRWHYRCHRRGNFGFYDP